MPFFHLLIILILIWSNPIEKELDAGKYFQSYGVDGCFMLYDQTENDTYIYNKNRCNNGFIPKSTFKIPHALIALEAGVLADENQIIPWDGTEHPFSSWNQDQNLQSALKYSCVWFFSELTKGIDSLTYLKYLDQFDYGNKNITGPHSSFWLFGELKISASEQLSFLQRFYFDGLQLEKRNTDIVKDLILLEETDQYRIYGKTGGGPVPGCGTIMWLVGFVEKEEDVYFYAMNFTCEEYNTETAKARFTITKNILNDLKII